MGNSSSPADSRFVLNQGFDDFDALTEAVRSWNLEYFQLDRGCFESELWQCGLSDVVMGRAKFNRRMEQHGESPEGLRTFVIPANRNLQMNWRRHDVGGDDLLVFPDGRELASITKVCFDVFTISLTDELLEQAAIVCDAPEVLRLMRSHEVLPLAPDACDRLRLASHAFIESLKENPAFFMSGVMDAELQKVLPGLLVQAISESMGRQRGAPGARERTKALKRAREAIAEFANEPITVTRLCEISGMSERSLQYAFREKFGITPKAYLQSYRLNRVRKKLRTADPASQMIVDLANEWGFWHMGQFAKDYQRQFGELPSETLRGRSACS